MHKIIRTLKVADRTISLNSLNNKGPSNSNWATKEYPFRTIDCYDKGTLQEMKDALLYLRNLMRYLNYENIFLDSYDVPCETRRREAYKLSVKVDRPNMFGPSPTLEYRIIKD